MGDPYVTATHPALNSVCCYTLCGKPQCPPPQKKGDKIKAGPKEGGNATLPLHSRGSPTKEIKIKAGPKEGGNATSPLHSRGSLTKGTKSKHQKKNNRKT